jgi:hypothetical protein
MAGGSSSALITDTLLKIPRCHQIGICDNQGSALLRQLSYDLGADSASSSCYYNDAPFDP